MEKDEAFMKFPKLSERFGGPPQTQTQINENNNNNNYANDTNANNNNNNNNNNNKRQRNHNDNGTTNYFKKDDSSTHTPVRLVLVDNVAAFYWIDRASRRDKYAPFNLQNVHFSVGQKMQTVARKRRITFFCTKTTTKLDPIGMKHKDVLPLPWSNCVTQRLLLDRRDKDGIIRWDIPEQRNSCGYTITKGGLRVV